MFDREKQGAYALEVEARDGAPSARPNSNQQPNSGKWQCHKFSLVPFYFEFNTKLTRRHNHTLRELSGGCDEWALHSFDVNYAIICDDDDW